MQTRTQQTYLRSAVTVALVGVLASTALAQSGNPNIGTWKANIAKSTFTPATATTSSSTKIEAAGAGIKATIDSVPATGAARHWTFTANYDGKDSPITGNSQYGDSVALTRVDANTTRSVYKKGGTVMATQTTVVSGDGKTRTVTTTGKNVLGQALNTVQLFDRQ